MGPVQNVAVDDCHIAIYLKLEEHAGRNVFFTLSFLVGRQSVASLLIDPYALGALFDDLIRL
jgi:hypothetical protein